MCITANAGAMVYMSGNIDIDTKTRDGGFFAELKVSTLGGQSLFIDQFSSSIDGSKLGLTGRPLGDIIKISILQDEEFIVQSGSFRRRGVGYRDNWSLNCYFQTKNKPQLIEYLDLERKSSR